MTRILIPTYPEDIHAVEVALALEARGHEGVLWFGSDFPTLQTASLEFRAADADITWEVEGPGSGPLRPPFDVVWLRRPTPSMLPADMHPGDRPVAQRECRDFVGGLYHLAAPDAFWVNPLASRRSESKALQLREAMRSGLTVPPTLMSNDPARIRRFLREAGGPVVYKPFNPAQWEGSAGVATLWTDEITAEDLPEDEILRLTPGIFQPKIPKAHELRVTILGAHVVTARLLSQERDEARLDWRAGGASIRVEPGRLPADVERACFRLMERLGIVFGCFDFIVTPVGGHVFLEVNPAGQFLWVEEACPDLRLLAPFVDFLLARDPAFRWPAVSDAIRHADFHRAAAGRIESTQAQHVRAEEVFVSRED